MIARSLGHRAPLLWLLLPYLVGIAGARVFPVESSLPLLLAALVSSLIAILAARRAPMLWGAALGLALMLAGSVHFNLQLHRLPEWDRLPPREAELELDIQRAFASRWPGWFTGLATVAAASPPFDDLLGQKLYASMALPEGREPPIRSSRVAAIGVITVLPRDSPANSFEAYLASTGANFRLQRGRLLMLLEPPSRWRRFCAATTARFETILTQGVPAARAAQAAAFRALVLGQRSELAEDQAAAFRLSGTMHVFTISGLHIAVLAGALRAFLSLLRIGWRVQLPLRLFALWLYVEVTGTAPAAVRAFLMVALLELAFALRRPLNPLAALAASAWLVVLFQPRQFLSASFQMSYGIVASLILLGLPLSDSWQRRPDSTDLLPTALHTRWITAQRWVRGHLIRVVPLALAASLVAALTGLNYFRLLTPGAVVLNLLLVPAAGGVVHAGFFSLLCGLVGFEAGSVLFNHAGVVILLACERLIDAFLRLPGAWLSGQFARPWLGPALLAGLLGILAFGYALRWTPRAGGFWTPFVYVGLCLLLLVEFAPG